MIIEGAKNVVDAARITRDQRGDTSFSGILSSAFAKILINPSYRIVVLALGAPVTIFVYLYYLLNKSKDSYYALLEETRDQLLQAGLLDRLKEEIRQQLLYKYSFFGQKVSQRELERQIEKLADIRFREAVEEETSRKLQTGRKQKLTFTTAFQSLMEQRMFLLLSFVPGLLMYLLILLYSNPYLKYIFERFVMSLFVIFGVSVLVFTILYLSPMNPAANILGETATEEQIANFNHVYGLDQPYLVQLWNSIKGIATFDLGKSFAGNEQVTDTIARKFPITLTLTLISLILAIIIAFRSGLFQLPSAIPCGIIHLCLSH